MQVVTTVLVTIQMLSAIIMIGLILVQHGKGADMGAAFGSGSSGSLFGASGSANFMSRATAVLAGVFFVCTLALAYFSGVRPASSGSILEKATVSAPADGASSAPVSAPIPTGAAPVVLPAAPAASSMAPLPSVAATSAPVAAVSAAATTVSK